MRFSLAVFLCVLFYAHAAQACSCGNADIEGLYERAVGVFSGTVQVTEATQEELRATLKPIHWWKGASAQEVTVVTNPYPTACGVDFRKGQKYIVFAFENESRDWSVHPCRATRPLENADKTIATLKKLAKTKRDH